MPGTAASRAHTSPCNGGLVSRILDFTESFRHVGSIVQAKHSIATAAPKHQNFIVSKRFPILPYRRQVLPVPRCSCGLVAGPTPSRVVAGARPSRLSHDPSQSRFTDIFCAGTINCHLGAKLNRSHTDARLTCLHTDRRGLRVLLRSACSQGCGAVGLSTCDQRVAGRTAGPSALIMYIFLNIFSTP